MLLEGSGDLLDLAHALVDAFEAPLGSRSKQRQALDSEHVALGEGLAHACQAIDARVGGGRRSSRRRCGSRRGEA